MRRERREAGPYLQDYRVRGPLPEGDLVSELRERARSLRRAVDERKAAETTARRRLGGLLISIAVLLSGGLVGGLVAVTLLVALAGLGLGLWQRERHRRG